MDNYADLEIIPEFRQRGHIAKHLIRNVCLCQNSSGLSRPPDRRGMGCVCKDCDKLPVYWIHKCVRCDKEFLHDFYLNFCTKAPLCWDCNNQDNEACEYHLYCQTGVTDEQKVPPAVELKIPFTDADYEGVFDFLDE